MTLVAEIRLSHPDLTLTQTIETVPEVTVTVAYPTVSSSGESWLLFAVEDGDNFEAFDEALAADSTVSDPLVVVGDANRRIYRVRLLSDLLLSSVTAELGIHVLELRSHGSKWLAKLQTSDREALVSFREYCEQANLDFKTDRLYTVEDKVAIDQIDAVGLTSKQRDTLTAAYEAGYFSTPRQTSLRELAETLGVSSTAVSKRLRGGTERLVAALVGRNSP